MPTNGEPSCIGRISGSWWIRRRCCCCCHHWTVSRWFEFGLSKSNFRTMFFLKKKRQNRFERDLSWALTWIWLINAHFCRRIRSQPFQRQTYSVRYLTWFEQVWWKTDRAVGNDLNERTSVFVRLGTRERERESRVTFGNCPIRRCNPIGWHSSVWSRVRPVLFSVLVAFSCSTFDFVSSSASSLVLPVVLRAFV